MKLCLFIIHILFAFAHSISQRWGFGYNLGLVLGDENVGIYSAALGVECTDRIGLFLECYGDIPEGQEASLYFDAGLTCLINPRVQWDFSIGIATQDAVPEQFVSTGLSVRLPK